MTQFPSMLRMFSHMWAQKFKANPVATVLGTVLSGGLLVGVLFFSVVFAVGLLLVGVIAFVYMKLFGSTKSVNMEYVIRKDFSRAPPVEKNDRPDIIEGDFDVLESSHDNTSRDNTSTKK